MIALEEEPIRDFSPYLVSVYSLNYGQFTHDLSELFPSSQGLHVRLCGFVNIYHMHIYDGLISINIIL